MRVIVIVEQETQLGRFLEQQVIDGKLMDTSPEPKEILYRGYIAARARLEASIEKTFKAGSVGKLP